MVDQNLALGGVHYPESKRVYDKSKKSTFLKAIIKQCNSTTKAENLVEKVE